ncbi:MAG: homoserine dehydrogenase [Mogibacterium sp.]|nr:homoserine dehydrogenase [Mogibacterium sp.]
MKIAIMGFGTVGSGAYDVALAAEGIEVVKILDLAVRKGYEHLADIFTTDINDIVNDPEIELVVEAMGGVDTPKKFVLACLNAGKHVVTPNKNLISACYQELMDTASKNGVELRFTPSAGGGIPWLYNLLRTRRCDRITEVRGIVNGTCNFILDAMYDSGADFGEMLKTAQELGYAEANPAADIEGTDTLRKTVISSNFAFGTIIKEEDVPCYGIDTISADDVAYLKEKGLACRLMMNARRCGDTISAYVEPVAFPITSLEANVRTNNNLITLVGESVGTQSFYGQGAGKLPTGESVVQDIIDIKEGISMNIPAESAGELKVDNDSEVHRYYIRHNRMCEHISPMIDTYEEKDGIFYCISKPVSVTEMHKMGQHRKEKGKPMFFAALAE